MEAYIYDADCKFHIIEYIPFGDIMNNIPEGCTSTAVCWVDICALETFVEIIQHL